MAFVYEIYLTGDCSYNGSGVAQITILNQMSTPTTNAPFPISSITQLLTPPYTFEWISPNLGVDYSLSSITKTNLYPGDYIVNVYDSSLPTRFSDSLFFTISSGFTCNVSGVSKTTCGLNNGSVTATTNTSFSSINYNIYTSNNDLVVTTSLPTYDFLSAGTYYIVAQDFGGCSATSESFIVENSEPFDFGLYVIPTTNCGGPNSGKMFVTGQTYGSPYTYLWSNNLTGSSITGLSVGSYSVTVTNSEGCSVTKGEILNQVDAMGVLIFDVTQPTCFSNNGVISMKISGGTAPYYYSASTGYVVVSYSDTLLLTGLTSGQYNFQVTDATYCVLNTGVILETPNSVSSVNIQATNSTCSSQDGSILVSINGGASPYTYTLVYPDSNSVVRNSNQTAYLFDKLTTGSYTVFVEDAIGCVFNTEVIIIAEDKFTISTSSTGTTTTNNYGSIEILLSTGGTEPYNYLLNGNTVFAETIFTAQTIYNLAPGQYQVSVVDYLGCKQTANVIVEEYSPVQFYLTSKSTTENDGEVMAYISSGIPPYTFIWSDNVSGNPQTIIATGLTAGTYSLTVKDKNESILYREIQVNQKIQINSYETYIMGENGFELNTGGKYGISKMLNDGYYDLTSGHTECQFVSASFNVTVHIEPYSYESGTTFYTTTSLMDVPQDNLMYDKIKELLLGVLGINTVSIDELTNQITIYGDIFSNQDEIILVGVTLCITYDINCQL